MLEESHRQQQACGATWIDLLPESSLSNMFPWLALQNSDHNVSMGSYGSKNEGYFDPWAMLQAMKKKSIELGVDYIDGEVVGANINHKGKYRIDSIAVKDTSNSNSNSKGDVVEYIGGNYVNTTGAFAGQFVEMLSNCAKTTNINTPKITALPVEARKRSVFVINCNVPEHTDVIVPPRSTPLVVDPSGIWFRYKCRTVVPLYTLYCIYYIYTIYTIYSYLHTMHIHI